MAVAFASGTTVTTPTLYLAFPGGGAGSVFADALRERYSTEPAVLVAYPYLSGWLTWRHEAHFRGWALDSGAVAALEAGTPINLQAFTECALELQGSDPKLQDIFALDVIGDWKQSLRNAEYMWKRGVRAVPCYHIGEPEHVLLHLAKHYPKIAVGGMKNTRRLVRMRLLTQVFARVWPCAVHGFALADYSTTMAHPFHSVDASSWQLGALKYRQFASMGRVRLRDLPLEHVSLRGEVEHYLERERQMQARWAPQMAALNGREHGTQARARSRVE